MREALKDRLKIVAEDEVLLAALKLHFDEIVEKQKPILTPLENNETLGERYRAYEQAKEIVKVFFTEMMNYRRDKIDKSTVNSLAKSR